MVRGKERVDSPRELYVLGMLSRGKTYGHELMRTVQVSRADLWVALSEKHVYYVLQKLARQGLVTETAERHGKRPPRKVYCLTASGRAALSELLCSRPLQEAFAPNPFDAVIGVLAYSNILDREASIGVLRSRREALVTRLAEHPAAACLQIEASYGVLARSLYEKARVLTQAEIRWLDRVLKRARSARWESMKVPPAYLKRRAKGQA
jgi:DNA-binding PadR family transcriptional regulator